MGAQGTVFFGDLLKEYRLAAGLTQEALAERAGLSARNIQALEGGRNRPFKDTAQRLAGALGLSERQRALLLAAAVPAPRRRGSAPALASTGIIEQAPAPSPVARHNLPEALSSFIGRERERGAVRQLLTRARLVTLIGAGGVGKTRLALTVAQDLLEGYPDGVWLVELAALAGTTAGGGALVPDAVAQALGVREEPWRPLTETLVGHMRDRRLLLVLDNCEHLVEACAALAATLLRACPGLAALATSREPLRVAGEQRYRVPSLSVSDPRRLPAPELAGTYEAVRLFVQRAQEQRPDFALDERNGRAVAEICARLDGIPLAIELAAARVASLSAEEIAARLDDRFRLLTGGSRDALPRQQTLRATLDWSYDLLSQGEQALLDRLSVFAGGWTLRAAEAVCPGIEEEQPGPADGVPAAVGGLQPGPPGLVGADELLDLLGGLLNKSLALAEEAGGEVRYSLLETVRQYGAERLATGGSERVRDRHLAHFLALAEEAEPALRGSEQGRWLVLLEAEHDNLRAALRWASEQGQQELGLRLAGALWRFWSMRGYFGEGQRWLEGLLAGEDRGSPATRARALNAAGDLAGEQGDYVRETILQEESLALWRKLGDRQGIATSLNHLAWVASLQGDLGRAVALREECLALMRTLGDRWGSAYSLHHLAWMLGQRGDFARAVTLQEEGLALWRALGDRWGIARSLGNLGRLLAWQGEYQQALVLHEESLALYRALEDKAAIATTLNQLGWLAGRQGEYARALALLEESLALQRELGDRRGMARSLSYLGRLAGRQGDCTRALAHCQEGIRLARDAGARDLVAGGLEVLAWVTSACGQAVLAARLGGAAETLRAALGVPVLPALRADHDQAVQAMRAALGEAAFATAWAEGGALSPDVAVALALAGHAAGQ